VIWEDDTTTTPATVNVEDVTAVQDIDNFDIPRNADRNLRYPIKNWKKKENREGFFNGESDGRHYGGVLCAVEGLDTKCVQFRSGLGVLLDDEATKSAYRQARCSAWAGGYFDAETLEGKELEPWSFLVSKYVQRDSRPDPLPFCSPGNKGVTTSKGLLASLKKKKKE
jgi:hypothetical protein